MHTRNRKRREHLSNALFLAPYLILFIIWVVAPALAGLVISLADWSIFTGEFHFVGLNSYLWVLRDDLFLQALWNTTRYTFFSVVIGNAVSFLLAYGLSRNLRGKIAFQSVFFAPVVLSIGVVGVIWGWLYDTDFGILNDWLSQLGLPRFHWLTNPHFAMPSVITMVVWAGAGFNMMIYLAGLLSIPKMYYEASQIDGAGEWKQLIHVTLPLMRRTFAFTIPISIIGGFQVFDQPYILTGGGPDYTTYTLVYHIYSNAFRYLRMGYAAAVSYVLALIIFVFAFAQYRALSRKGVEY